MNNAIEMEKVKEPLDVWAQEEREEQQLVSWMKENKEHLAYEIDFKDVGYAFVEELVITDMRTDKEVYNTWFMHIDKAKEFADSIFE